LYGHVKLVVDAVAVRPGSAAIVTGNLLRGWRQAAPEDAIVVLTDGEPQFPVADGVVVQRLAEQPGLAGRLWAQSVGVRRACRQLGADALLSAVTAGAFLGAACPSGAIVYDVRHELRPDQFPLSRRAARRVLYGWTFHRADALFCISERTRNDLVAARPQLAGKSLATLLGADHAAGWKPADIGTRYVLAFGHFANKNVDAVLRAWARHAARPGADPEARLRVCGLGRDGRAAAEREVAELGLTERVELLGWLDDGDFEAVFAGASAIVFPSDFEGFGLPAVEALLLGVPVVISTDPALLEVSGGHAVVAADDRADTLADAIDQALHRSPEQIAAGVAHARAFTWARMATQIRTALRDARADLATQRNR
jgi:glycosyltransferase involved in cell wall biosynthesis